MNPSLIGSVRKERLSSSYTFRSVYPGESGQELRREAEAETLEDHCYRGPCTHFWLVLSQLGCFYPSQAHLPRNISVHIGLGGPSHISHQLQQFLADMFTGHSGLSDSANSSIGIPSSQGY